MNEDTPPKLARLAELASTPERRVSPAQHSPAAGTRAQLLEDAVAQWPVDEAHERWPVLQEESIMATEATYQWLEPKPSDEMLQMSAERTVACPSLANSRTPRQSPRFG